MSNLVQIPSGDYVEILECHDCGSSYTVRIWSFDEKWDAVCTQVTKRLSAGKMGEQYCEKLFNCNRSLVPWVYSRYFYHYPEYKDDLLQEGFGALVKATRAFDNSHKVAFNTYAVVVIKRTMMNYVHRFILKNSKVMSLSDIVGEDDEGNTLLIEDMLGNPDEIQSRFIIQDCLHRLPHKEQKIILSLMRGFTQNEIAKRQEVSQATISRCLTKFKQIYMEETR